MLTKKIPLFRAFGIPIGIDASWFIILILVTWSLAAGLFPDQYEGMNTSTYWIMGLVGAVGLFFSIILHELGHALTAQQYGLHIRGITLFIFGGVAEMQDEPPTPASEFLVAVAGPVVSVVLAILAYIGLQITQAVEWPASVAGVLWYLALINAIVVLFNLVPAFPLDGGRILRAALWKWKGRLRKATQVTSGIGSGFGMVLIIFGVFSFISGGFIMGMWWFLLGMFLRGAAQMSFQQLLVRRVLEGEPIRRFMAEDVHSVPPDITLETLLQEHIYTHHHKLFPVRDNGHLQGYVTTRQIRSVPRDEWNRHLVKDAMLPCGRDVTVSPDADAMQTLLHMNRTGVSRMLVLDQDRLVGIVALKDLVKFLSLKLEIEEDIDVSSMNKSMRSTG